MLWIIFTLSAWGATEHGPKDGDKRPLQLASSGQTSDSLFRDTAVPLPATRAPTAPVPPTTAPAPQSPVVDTTLASKPVVLQFDCVVTRVQPCPVKTVEALRSAGIGLADVAFAAEPLNATSPVTPPRTGSAAAAPLRFAHNSTQSMAMASTARIVTALAALENLGPRFAWRTRAYTVGTLSDGVLQGDLLIVGGGDAMMTGAQLRSWLKRLQQQGLREIHGNIILDLGAIALKDQDFAGTPPEDADNPHHRWPEAFVVNEGQIEAEVSTASGQLEIRFQPPLAQVPLVNRLQQKNCGKVELTPVRTTEGAALIVEGDWAARCGTRKVTFTTDSREPLLLPMLAGVWQETGGVLQGTVLHRAQLNPKNGKAQWVLPKKPFDTWVSAPLPNIVRDMDKSSNNILARHLMLSLAPGFPQKQATMQAARQRMRSWLQKIGLSPTQMDMDNGSGLSRGERAQAAAMVALLGRAWRSKTTGKILQNSLPVVGVDGTMARRLRGTAAQNRAWLKTGTLNDTRALAGYVLGKSGTLYAVATFINHPAAARGVAALDAFIEWLALNG